MSLVKINPSTYNDAYALEDVVNYCEKSEHLSSWSGLGVLLYNAESMINSMRIVKAIYGKQDGKQLHHMIISIHRDKYTKNLDEQNCKIRTEESYQWIIGAEVCEFIYNMGFQNAYYLHVKSENLHLHYIINSVSYMTGEKLTDLYAFKSKIEFFLKGNYPFLQWL